MALTNRTLILFKYFWETTDEAHPISLTDISAHLKEHGITADPRTLRSDIEQLVEFGVDIVKNRRVQNLYHVAIRHFEVPEVKLPLQSGKIGCCATCPANLLYESRARNIFGSGYRKSLFGYKITAERGRIYGQ